MDIKVHVGVQMVVCGLLLIAMASGNFANTIATLVAKAKVKAKMKKMKHVGNQMLTGQTTAD